MKKLKCFTNAFLLFLLIYPAHVKAQDTTAIVNEFNKVMAFTVQPYVHYVTVTKIEATPVMHSLDTSTITGEFFKNEKQIYYSNNQEMLFVEDSLFIQINHGRKSIWLSKIDPAGLERMNFLPLSDKDLQQLFQKKFTISKTSVSALSRKLTLTSNREDNPSAPHTIIQVQYAADKLLPELFVMSISIKQPVNDDVIKQLGSYGENVEKALVSIGDNRYLIRNQTASVRFYNIENTQQKAGSIPSWKNVLNYSSTENSFSGNGIYSAYEITKTF